MSTAELQKQIDKNYGVFTYLGFVAAVSILCDAARAADLPVDHPVRSKMRQMMLLSEAETIAMVNARSEERVGRKHRVLARLEADAFNTGRAAERHETFPKEQS